MTFNCLNCDNGAGLWGNPSVPPHPSGFYRAYWQAADSVGCARKHPACAMQMAGRIQRGDHWDPREFKLLLDAMAPGHWYPRFNTVTFIPGTPDQVASLAISLAGPTDANFLRMWTLFRDPSDPTHPFVILGRSQAPNFTHYDMRDMSHWLFGTAPPRAYTSLSHAFVLTINGGFPDPWINPI